jgi:hypothetical protein
MGRIDPNWRIPHNRVVIFDVGGLKTGSNNPTGIGKMWLPQNGASKIDAPSESSPHSQMLFDPLEESFHLPAITVNLRDPYCRQLEMAGQKVKMAFPIFNSKCYPAKLSRILPARGQLRPVPC